MLSPADGSAAMVDVSVHGDLVWGEPALVAVRFSTDLGIARPVPGVWDVNRYVGSLGAYRGVRLTRLAVEDTGEVRIEAGVFDSTSTDDSPERFRSVHTEPRRFVAIVGRPVLFEPRVVVEPVRGFASIETEPVPPDDLPRECRFPVYSRLPEGRLERGLWWGTPLDALKNGAKILTLREVVVGAGSVNLVWHTRRSVNVSHGTFKPGEARMVDEDACVPVRR